MVEFNGRSWLKSANSNIADMMGTNRNIVRMLDKERLESIYGGMEPERRPTFIGIDEFSLHKGHRYATVVVDLCTGHVIFLEEGSTKAQAEHFIRRMGSDVMKGIVGVSMDMNAQFSSVFEELCPWIKIVYDPFHIIKHYNDNVLTEIRRGEQRRLLEGVEKARKEKDWPLAKELKLSHSVLKRSNFLILANRTTLKARDEASKAHNLMLYETYERKGLPLPDARTQVAHVRRSQTQGDTLLQREDPGRLCVQGDAAVGSCLQGPQGHGAVVGEVRIGGQSLWNPRA